MESKKEGNKEEAVALKYDTNQDIAPIVVAKGKGDIAKQIIQAAEEHKIPIKEDRDLVEVLLHLELGEEIPETLYKVVAEILSFIYDLDDLA